MKIDASKNYMLSFYVYTGVAPSSATVAPTLVVSQSNDDYDYNELITIDVTTGDAQWTLFELPINNLDGNFMKFSFRGYMNNVYERIWLDNITVKEKQIDGIESVEALAPSVVATKGGIAVNGVLGQVVNIYSIDGKLIDSV